MQGKSTLGRNSGKKELYEMVYSIFGVIILQVINDEWNNKSAIFTHLIAGRSAEQRDIRGRRVKCPQEQI